MVKPETVVTLWVLTTVLVSIVGVMGFVAGYVLGRYGHAKKKP